MTTGSLTQPFRLATAGENAAFCFRKPLPIVAHGRFLLPPLAGSCVWPYNARLGGECGPTYGEVRILHAKGVIMIGKLIVAAAGYATNVAARRFEEATRDCAGVQQRKLLGIIEQNTSTEYGKRHGFGALKTVADYQKNVPVINYEDISDDMKRVTEGAKGVFTAEDPVLFAQTSGTTGDPKFIPVTPSCKGKEQGSVMKTWLSHARRDHPQTARGKTLTLVSPAIEGYTPSGIPFGSTSGHIVKNLPSFVTRHIYAIPYYAFEIADYGAKYFAIMRFGLEQDVTFIGTANPSSVLKMCQKGDEHASQIIKDIHDGTLSKDFPIEDDIRRELSGRLKPNPKRARFLENCNSKRKGRMLPGDYWPNLGLIGCWKGGTVGHYLDRFGDWFDPDGRRAIPIRDWGYLSSEARGSIPLSDEGSAGVLTIATNFFEFVEPDDLERHPDDWSQWRFYTADQVQQGQQYYIFLTTTGGLYRYDINDVVEVVGAYNTTPQIVFKRKGRGMTNITGEKLSVNQVIDAIHAAEKANQVVADHFKAEADTANSRYICRVELGKAVGPEVLQGFLKSFDDHLRSINIEYKAKRDSNRLNAPVLHVMREGWYERNRRAQVSEGKRAFQAKTELLSPSKMATMEVRTDLKEMVELAEV